MRRTRRASETEGAATVGQGWPLFRLLVSVGLLGLIVSRLDLARAAEILSSAHIPLLVLAVLVGYAGRFTAALRWWILLRAMDTRVPYRGVVRLTFIGMFLHFLPAGSAASEVARVYGINRSTSDLAGSFASVLVDRVFGLSALILVGLTGLLFAPTGVPPILSDLAWLGFIVVFTAGYVTMNAPARRVVGRLLLRIGLDRTQERLGKVHSRIDQMRVNVSLLGWSVIATLANTGFRILPTWFVAMALDIDVSLMHLFIIIPLIYLAAQIPISVGGLGVREVGWVALLGVVGVPAPDAIVMSLLLATMIFVVSLPGAWLYIRHGLGVPEGEMPTESVSGTASDGSAPEVRDVRFRASRRV